MRQLIDSMWKEFINLYKQWQNRIDLWGSNLLSSEVCFGSYFQSLGFSTTYNVQSLLYNLIFPLRNTFHMFVVFIPWCFILSTLYASQTFFTLPSLYLLCAKYLLLHFSLISLPSSINLYSVLPTSFSVLY